MRYGMVTAVMLAVLAPSGCRVLDGSGDAQENKSSMNMQEDADRADRIVKDAFDVLVPPVRWAHRESTDSTCNDFKNDSIGKGTVTRRAAVMTVISKERMGSLLGIVERSWKNSGYTITNVRNYPENPAIFASAPDDFRMSLEVGYKRQVFLDVVTSCTTESEVSPPKTEANAPDYSEEDRIPPPNEHSDFWSATM